MSVADSAERESHHLKRDFLRRTKASPAQPSSITSPIQRGPQTNEPSFIDSASGSCALNAARLLNAASEILMNQGPTSWSKAPSPPRRSQRISAPLLSPSFPNPPDCPTDRVTLQRTDCRRRCHDQETATTIVRDRTRHSNRGDSRLLEFRSKASDRLLDGGNSSSVSCASTTKTTSTPLTEY